jgi:hypothetical protein
MSPARDGTEVARAAQPDGIVAGAPPEQIIATLYHNNPTKGIAAQRPWRPYPATARFSGQGARTEAASYACAPPAK